MACKLSEAEKVFIIHGAEEDLRVDGRCSRDYRPIVLEIDVVGNASGSARIRLGNSDVLVGVKAELDSEKQSDPTKGSVSFFVDCSANAAPEFEGRGGEEIARDLQSALTGAFSNDTVLDLTALCIVPQHYYWSLYVDVVILEYGGTLYDAAGLAVKAALSNVQIPNLKVLRNEKGEPDVEITDDPYDCWQLNVDKVPLLVSVNKLGQANVIDATFEEELCTLSRLVYGVLSSGDISFIRQEGRGSLDPDSIAESTDLAVTVGKDLQNSLHSKLQEALKENVDLSKPKTFGFVL